MRINIERVAPNWVELPSPVSLMLSLSAVLFCIASVAFAATPHGPIERPLALLCGACALAASVMDHGALRGLIVLSVALMAALSGLVLVLAPEPRWARPTAVLCTLSGLSAWALWFSGAIT